MGAPIGLHLLVFAFRKQAFGDQLLGIKLPCRALRPDLAIHDRLRERRFVAFVVTKAAVAEHVDDHWLVEHHAELDRDLGRIDDSFRIVSVDVENRCLDHLRHIGRIGRRAGKTRIGRETDLVIDDEMERAGHAMAAQSRKPQHFGHHTLAGERRIAVEQQRQHFRAVFQ